MTDYKPIDNSYTFIDTDLPFPSIMGDVIGKNLNYTVDNRFRKQAVVYHPGPTDISVTADVINSFNSSNLIGYPMDSFLPGTDVNNRGLVGLQFSTHPSCPMYIPIMWNRSMRANQIKVRVCAEVYDAPVDMVAYYYWNNKFHPSAPNYLSFSEDTYLPSDPETGNSLSITQVKFSGSFPLDVQAQQNYVSMQPTDSTYGTTGLSYHELTIELENELEQFDHLDSEGYSGHIILGFASRIGDAEVTHNNIERISLSNNSFDSFGHGLRTGLAPAYLASRGATSFGKFHKLASILQSDPVGDGQSGGNSFSYHHVMQTQYYDDAIVAEPVVDFYFHPRIPFRSTLQNMQFYDLGNVVLHSVTIEDVRV